MDDLDDSLFEGMVLFNPPSSQLPLELPVINDNNSAELPNHREISPQQPESPTPAVMNAAGASIEPLDENLFSDLTLIQPQSQNEDVSSSSLDQTPVSPSSSSTSSRSTIDVVNSTTTAANATLLASPSQGSISRSHSSHNSSTRKKKKAGLRIGYGRAAQSHDPVVDVDEPQLQTEPVVVSEEKQETRIQKESGISSGSTVVETTTADVVEQVSTIKDVPQEEEVTQVEKEISIEERYDLIKQKLAEKFDFAYRAVTDVSNKRKELIRKRRKGMEELNIASGKYKEMEKELEEAVESEDFETAERVSDSLASAEKNKELLLIALREAEAECDAVDIKMQEVLEKRIVIEEECAAVLESFAVDADRDADSVISNAETKTSEEMEMWFSLYEALEVKKMEVDVENCVLSGVRQVLDDSIEHVIKDDKEESQNLLKKKKILEEELQELLKLVKQKEAEISENDSKIENVEKKMADAVSGFHEAQTNIKSKSESLQSGLSQLELENDDLTRKKKEIDDFHLQEETRGSKIKELSRISADEAGMYQENIHLRKILIEYISKSREDKIRLAKKEQNLFDDVQILKQDIASVRASLQDLSSTKSGTQQEIESSKQRLIFIDKRLPEIESEKRVAATARNFKEAARIANEAKALYVEKETLQLKIQQAMADLKTLEDEINNNVERLQEKEHNISLMEKELEIVRYQRLILVAAAAMADYSAAKELGDVEEAEILLKESQVADFEAKKIQETFKEGEFDSVPKLCISLELVSTLDTEQLAELAASTQMAAP
ncbi:uncharacterized protein [Rutidosis leptorrhynchoides]|uniref:uncharacterized protein n=1 Tax=Rutidosis leptorrhynchoides TaxID=125765 RepID=UPI003A99A9AF